MKTKIKIISILLLCTSFAIYNIYLNKQKINFNLQIEQALAQSPDESDTDYGYAVTVTIGRSNHDHECWHYGEQTHWGCGYDCCTITGYYVTNCVRQMGGTWNCCPNNWTEHSCQCGNFGPLCH